MSSSTEKLKKFFKLEIERKYDNRAVVGGLDKILPSWEKEARSESLRKEFINRIREKLVEYSKLDISNRGALLTELLGEISQQIQVKPITQPVPKSVAPTSTPVSEPARRKVSKTPTMPRETMSISNVTPNTGLHAPLDVIKGIGSKYYQALKKMDLFTLGDLLYYVPRRYDDYSELKTINRVEYQDEITIIAAVHSITTRPIRGGKMKLTEAVVTDGTGFLRLTWFNQPWVAKNYPVGTQLVISGKVDMYLGRLMISNPDCELVEQEHLHTNRIVPIYPLTDKITQKWIRKAMYQTVMYWAPRVFDHLPVQIRLDADILPLQEALLQVHFPDSIDHLHRAKYRLAFDEIFLMQLGVLSQKRNWQALEAAKYSVGDEWMEEIEKMLPYQLTNAQSTALQDVRTDLNSGHPMNRLIQGDVGSGKTIVAFIAAAMVMHQDAQAAIMAPTSILAEQHYNSFSRMMVKTEDNPQGIVEQQEVALLLGSTPEDVRQEIAEGLQKGLIKMIIGTHALLQDPVVFKNLQFVVVDEQHRFGVQQRATLREKGNNPHLLVMTATPIPRSLALTVYGDLDLSVMDEMPAGRLPIETHILAPIERNRGHQFIIKHAQDGHQAFIIYPLVEGGNDETKQNKAAVDEFEKLQTEVFGKFRLGLLHGRLKPAEKEEVMLAFNRGEIDILISTSVVEVGVDVPNATVMLVEGANRFGLAQLHQFRGRVGRGDQQSYCLLIPETDDALENERLKAMAASNDGFVLAEKDLQQRGPGAFLGTRQSGFTDLKFGDITDVRLIEKARNLAKKIFEQDPDLVQPQHKELNVISHVFWQDGKGDIS
ncbi:MAG: ATP-dependent DNA helicase RecG [Anaerolineaceae bacterium]|nr:ATP-dependent DNA helicase RecG [Anaerolineaceae bacterium]